MRVAVVLVAAFLAMTSAKVIRSEQKEALTIWADGVNGSTVGIPAVRLVNNIQMKAGGATVLHEGQFMRSTDETTVTVLSDGNIGSVVDMPAVDCQEYPMFCNPLLDCPNFDPQSQDFGTRVATADGHVNLQSWCVNYPKYADLVQDCIINGDLVSSAKNTFEEQKQAGADEADGSYCFLAGHCVNTHVTADTTAEQAEAFCNDTYGHDRWANISFAEVIPSWTKHIDLKHGFDSRASAVLGAILACAMGNYHCDVVYCQEMYCNVAHYRDQYGHLSPSP